jgi:hypothetical protein
MKDPGAPYANRLFLEEITHPSGPLLMDSYGSRTVRVEGVGEIIHLVQSNTEYRFVIAALMMAGVVIAWRRRVI